MKWIRFFAISVFICLGSNRANACTDYYTPEMCNMFSVFNYNDLFAFNQSFYGSQLKFWKSYFGKTMNEKTIQDDCSMVTERSSIHSSNSCNNEEIPTGLIISD